MMNPDIKAKWIAALRSGNYDQCTGKLSSGLGYCCLGVLQELTGIPEQEGHAVLDYTAAAKIGLGIATQEGLSGMNDAEVPFAEIADHIERTL